MTSNKITGANVGGPRLERGRSLLLTQIRRAAQSDNQPDLNLCQQ